MSNLKQATKNLLNAGRELTKSLVDEGKEQYVKHIKPVINNIQSTIELEKTKKEIQSKKAVNIKQDKSRRKYHRGS